MIRSQGTIIIAVTVSLRSYKEVDIVRKGNLGVNIHVILSKLTGEGNVLEEIYTYIYTYT